MNAKTKKQITWVVSNTIYFATLYAGVVMGDAGFARVYLILFWMNFILQLIVLLNAKKLNQVSEEMATEGFPRWVHFAFDLSCAALLAYFDWMWIAALTVVEHFAWVSMVDELQKRKKVLDEERAKDHNGYQPAPSTVSTTIPPKHP